MKVNLIFCKIYFILYNIIEKGKGVNLFMKCGYCQNEMKEGWIPTAAIEWIPCDGELKLRYDKQEKEKGFRLGKHQFFDKKKQKAWYCSICDVILIDCKDE